MKFVKFVEVNYDKQDEIWINPDTITCIKECTIHPDNPTCHIYFINNGTCQVVGSLKNVTRELNER